VRALAALLIALPCAVHAACAPDRVEFRGDFGAAGFSVEVADDATERSVGLMNRPSMPSGHGMLFLYDRPQPVSFWMRNTLIPLDMIFLDETGRVKHVHEGAVPLDETPIPGGDGILAVVEINGGLAGRIGIAPGAEMRHPAFDQPGAAWPCTD
jgi:uncharacterized membrane protein (UPF0127 family)